MRCTEHSGSGATGWTPMAAVDAGLEIVLDGIAAKLG
jgi:hypothetical protein